MGICHAVGCPGSPNAHAQWQRLLSASTAVLCLHVALQQDIHSGIPVLLRLLTPLKEQAYLLLTSCQLRAVLRCTTPCCAVLLQHIS